MTSGSPNVVAAFVNKHKVAHYGMVHKPGCVIYLLDQHIRSVSVSRKGPYQFHSKHLQSWILGFSGVAVSSVHKKTEVIIFTSWFTKISNIKKFSFANTIIELTEREFVIFVLI